jgi:hypothetical protein
MKLFWLAGCACLIAAACAEKKVEKPEKKPDTDALRLVARVQSRPGDKDFVLLEAYGKWTIAEGAVLHSYGPDGRSASLLITGEKLGQFVAADVTAGQVEIGDAVYHRTKVAASTASRGTPTQDTATTLEKPVADEPAASNTSASPVIEPVPLPSQ